MIDQESIKAIGRSILAARGTQQEAKSEGFKTGEARPESNQQTNETSNSSQATPTLARYVFPELDEQINTRSDQPILIPQTRFSSQEVSTKPTDSSEQTINLTLLRQIIRRCRQREFTRQHVAADQQKQKGYQCGLEQGLEEGRKQGLESGYQESIAMHNESAEKWNQQVSELWNELQNIHDTTVIQLGEAIIDVVTQVAEKVLKQELSLSRASIQPMVENAVKQFANAPSLSLRIHPDDKNLLTPVVNGLPGLTILEDQQITPGGFVLKSDKGEIDATIERRCGTCFDAIHQPTASETYL